MREDTLLRVHQQISACQEADHQGKPGDNIFMDVSINIIVRSDARARQHRESATATAQSCRS